MVHEGEKGQQVAGSPLGGATAAHRPSPALRRKIFVTAGNLTDLSEGWEADHSDKVTDSSSIFLRADEPRFLGIFTQLSFT